MLRFLSKIRYKLAAENNAIKYFRYAIGEIVLVMIGILLALQVNNWNEERKKSQDIKMGLYELKNNLIADSVMIEKIAGNLNVDLEYQQALINKLETDEVLDSTYNTHLGRVGLMRRTNFIHNGYDGLKTLGFENINNPNLRKAILAYYNDLIFQILKDIEDDEDEFKNLFLPYIRQNYIDWKFGSYGVPRSYEEISNDAELEITLRINYLNRLSTLNRLKEATKELKKIIDFIDLYTNDKTL